MPYSDAEILQFVRGNLSNPAAIAAAMQQYGVPLSDVQRATGWSPGQLTQYFGQAGVQVPGIEDWRKNNDRVDPDTLAWLEANKDDWNMLGSRDGYMYKPEGGRQYSGGDGGSGWIDNPVTHWSRQKANSWDEAEQTGTWDMYDANSGGYSHTWRGERDEPLATGLLRFAAMASGIGSLGGALTAGSLAGAGAGFVGEGALSGIPAWDAALANSPSAFGTGAGFIGEGVQSGVPEWDLALDGASGSGGFEPVLGAEELGLNPNQFEPVTPDSMGFNPVNDIGPFQPINTADFGLTPNDFEPITPDSMGFDPVNDIGPLNPHDPYAQTVNVNGSKFPPTTNTLPVVLPGTLPSTPGPITNPGTNEITPIDKGNLPRPDTSTINTPNPIDRIRDMFPNVDPRNLQRLLAGLGLIDSLTNDGGSPAAPAAPSNPFGAYNDWTPEQKPAVTSFFNRAPQPFTPPPQRYAEGGGVEDDEGIGALSMMSEEQVPGGQDDVVEALLAPGEYVFDADTVASLGDGSNEVGAARLDAWRRRLRQHKRAASADDIPPKARAPEAYLKK